MNSKWIIGAFDTVTLCRHFKIGMSHKAIYGKVRIVRHLCPNCGNHILSNQKAFICDVCDYSGKDNETKGYKIIVPPLGYRNWPCVEIRKKLLEIQKNKCYWCERKFDTPYIKNGRFKYLKIHWDHKIPFSYEQANRDENWVASCNICNQFKYNFMFKYEKDCKRYLLKKWDEYLSLELIILEE